MTPEIKSFVNYLRDVRKISRNTEISYQQDLMQLTAYLKDKEVTEVTRVARTNLNSYILLLEKENKATTTMSRELASIKAFFSCLFREGMIHRDPAELLKAPKIKKKTSVMLSVNKVNALLGQPGTASTKEIRDKAILELLYATGIKVSELTELGFKDLSMQVGYITCRDGQKERMVPFGKNARQAMTVYLERGRKELLKRGESEWFLTNCSGKAMSRQSFWKIIEYYGERAGIETDIIPHTLRHPSATHLIHEGASIRTVQAMLSRPDSTTTQMYAAYSGGTMGKTYRAALRRK